MNNQEFNTSMPVSDKDSQTGSSEAESPVSGSELLQRSSSSQPENLDLPSSSSSEVGNGAAGKGIDKTSSGDEPESVSPEAISLSVPDLQRRLFGLLKLLFADDQRTFLRVLVASSCLRRGNRVYFWEECKISRDLLRRFWRALRNQSPVLVITHHERSFLEEFLRRPPYGIPTAIVNLFNFTHSPLLAARPSDQSIEALEVALVRVALKKFVGVTICYSRGIAVRKNSRTPESDASSELLDSQTSSSKFEIWLERCITIVRSFREIPRTSESSASSELRDSQPSHSAFENGVHESQIELKQIESGEDCYDTESLASGNTLKDGLSDESPREAQSFEMESTSENLEESLDRALADLLQVIPDAPPEESWEGEDCYDTESLASGNTLKDGLSDESPCEAQSFEMELKSENLEESLDHALANLLQVIPDAPSEESWEESPAKKLKMI